MTSIVLTLLFTAIGVFAMASSMRSLTGGLAAGKAIFEELYGEPRLLPATRRATGYAVTRQPASRRSQRPQPRPAACA